MSDNLDTIRVAVVEDHSRERENVVRLLRSSPGFECAAECASAAEALKVLPYARPQVVLMDINMPGQSGIECIRQLRPYLPETQFMMLTVYEDHSAIFESITVGATGYILKKSPATKILEAIRELHSGSSPMSGQIARKVLAAFRESLASASPPQDSPLSPAERNVLQLLGRGLLYKEVAEELRISMSTVRTHVHHIYRKLQVHNRTEAILKGLPQSR
jgi:DNA-binding NarL/FixJ family response regulator